MGQSSKRFSFDEFDHLCAEALIEDQRMVEEDEAWAEHEKWLGNDLRPGDIGAVAITPLYTKEDNS